MTRPGSGGAGNAGAAVKSAADALAPAMESLLTRLIRFESISGREGDLTRFLAEFGASHGLRVDLWQARE